MIKTSTRWTGKIAVTACVLLAFLFASLGGQAAVVTVKVLPGAWSGDTIDFIRQQAERWAMHTGNKVEFDAVPAGSSAVLAMAQQYLAAGSSDIDIYPVDVVWPGMLGTYFADLKPYFSKKDLAKFDPSAIAANTVGGKLVGVPFYGDVGLFYYRTDLLKKYGYSAPPATWEEMRTMAAKIVNGERGEGKANFWGYVFDGAAYEGLTCNTLEWVASYGGGTFVDAKGKITINNPKAVAAFAEVAKWVGTIVPPGVTSYKTEDARGVWQAGNAAFMRNWSFAYALGQSNDSPIKDKFAIGMVPHGPGGKSLSTLGGWQLAVSRFSKKQAQAASLIKFLTDTDPMKERLIKLARIPTIPALFADPVVKEAYPWIETLNSIKTVARPSAATGTKYNQASSAIWAAAQAVLSHETTPGTAVKNLEAELARLAANGW